jgi:hypothetical protein
METRSESIAKLYPSIVDRILKSAGLDGDDGAACQDQVVRCFLKSKRSARHRVAIDFLCGQIDKQENRAKFLNISRTAFARIEKHRRMKEEHFYRIVAHFRDQISFPSVTELTHRAAVETVNFAHCNVLKRPDVGDFTREEYEFLFEIFLDEDWRKAHQAGSVEALRKAFGGRKRPLDC